jgi:hypothetical protein
MTRRHRRSHRLPRAGADPKFIGRANHVSDHFGEKLHEVFVASASSLRCATCRTSLQCSRATATHTCSTSSNAPVDVAALDQSSGEPPLRPRRRLGQLAPLRMVRVQNGAATYLRVKSETQILGDIKIPALDREQGWSERFRP